MSDYKPDCSKCPVFWKVWHIIGEENGKYKYGYETICNVNVCPLKAPIICVAKYPELLKKRKKYYKEMHERRKQNGSRTVNRQ